MAANGIDRQAPLLAFDHLSQLILAKDEAGVTADQVHALIGELRKDGRGSEALAVNNLHAMLSHVDHGKGANITKESLSHVRTFLVRRLYLRGGPISTVELKGFSPTLRVLSEIGQVLDVERRPGRVPHQVPQQGMAHIAALLQSMIRPEGVITRHDRNLIVYELFEQGRGTEALAVRYFFNFIDHRSGGDADQIHPQDVDAAVAYADEKLLRNKDRDNNGYSADEIKRFSTTAKAFLRVGQMMEAGVIPPLSTPQ